MWARHIIVANPGGEELLFVDRNLVHEGGTFLAFDQMRIDGHTVRKPKQTLAVTDHYLPSTNRATAPASIANAEIRRVVEALDHNAREFGIEHYGVHHARQGIIHVIGPELGWTQPGLLIACCDSHTATHGALGALPIPIGQSNQLRHVLTTQTVWQKKPKTMRITIDGTLPAHVTAKDVILSIIARIGIGGAIGHAVVRFDPHEQPRTDFILNQPAYQNTGILVTGPDFGCGSSRESAAYATLDFGVRALIGASFGDVYRGNCMQNGVLTIVLPPSIVGGLIDQLRAAPGASMTVDLPNQLVMAPDGATHAFEIDATRKMRLLQGLDDVGVTLQHLARIEAFEAQYRADMPWLASIL